MLRYFSLFRFIFLLVLFISFGLLIAYKYHKHQFLIGKYTLGIDISHYQGNIDWSKVANSDIYFCFIKATESDDFLDEQYKKNIKEARKNNIKVGTYHFYRPNTNSISQANFFLKNISYIEGDIPPVLDIEVSEKHTEKEIIDGAKIWLEQVEKQLNVRPIIYTNQHFLDKYVKKNFKEYTIWIANYNKFFSPLSEKNVNYKFWQYSDEGNINGINEKVDCDAFKGNKQQFNKWLENY